MTGAGSISKVTDVIASGNISAGNGITATNGISGKSLTISTKYGITEDGKITGSQLALTDPYKILENGNATLKDITADRLDLSGIGLYKADYSMTDIDGERQINNYDALWIKAPASDKYSALATQAGENNSGIHVDGKVTINGPLAIGENTVVTTKFTHAGQAYFKQRLIIGGDSEVVNSADEATVAPGDIAATLWVNSPSTSNDKGRMLLNGYFKAAKSIYTDESLYVNDTAKIGTTIELCGEDGMIKATTYNATSDARKKTAIENYTCEKSILELPIRKFEFINDATHTKHIGCIAQDLQQICPELVHEDKDGFLSIEENKLVYLLLQEVKNLKEEIKSLKGE